MTQPTQILNHLIDIYVAESRCAKGWPKYLRKLLEEMVWIASAASLASQSQCEMLD